MSLTQMIAAHDDATLIALANKGLLRRALRDIKAGLVEVTERDANAATVNVDGQVIRLTGENPGPTDCACPATGFCRHLLGAIILLRDSTSDGGVSVSVSALDDLMALTDDDISKFAGADLHTAVALSTGGIQFSQRGTMIEAVMSGIAAPVQLLAGHPLKDAVFKGPAARKRLVTAAAVLAIRAKHGKPMDMQGVNIPDAQTKQLSQSFLIEVETALEHLLVATLAGAAQLHIDQVFDLSISARSQDAPRLTGALRGITAMAGLTINRDISFDPERFAVNVAQTYALVQALKAAPDDPALMGALHRSYSPSTPLQAMALGARSWQTASGARGLSVYLYDTTNNRWISSERGRAGGADPSFTAAKAYALPLLSAASVPELMGHCVSIDTPHLSPDLQLGTLTDGQCIARLTIKEIEALSVLCRDWDAVRRDLKDRSGVGLREANRPLPILLQPARIQRHGFDDLAQVFRLHVVDARGDRLLLTLPAKEKETVRWLETAGSKLFGLLCVTQPGEAFGTLAPVTALFDERGKVSVANLSLDPLPSRKGLLATLTHKFAGEMMSIRPNQTAIQRFSANLIRELCDHVSGADLNLTSSIRQSEALGLGVLHAKLKETPKSLHARSVLRLIYIADRVAV